MSWFSKARQFFSSEDSNDQPLSRRQFFTGVGGMALGAGLLLPDEAWAGVEDRAKQFGIEPGTLVDAQGRPMKAGSSQLFQPFIGGIVMFGGNFAPRGWALCDGSLLAISSFSALFSILGTTYGGDGRTSFGLPDLRGRFPMHAGSGPGLSPRRLGEKGGNEDTTLSTFNMPPHTHSHDEVLVRGIDTPQGTGVTDGAKTGTQASASTGNGTSFSNMPPFLAVNFIIALVGTFPSRN